MTWATSSHVQSARSDIGRDQHLIAAFLKSAQSGVALRLRAIAVNHGSREAVPFQFLGQPLRATLGARENQRLSLFFVEQLPQHVQLFGRAHFISLELHALRRLQDRAQSDPHRLARVVIHQRGHGLLHGGGVSRVSAGAAAEPAKCAGSTGRKPMSSMRSASSSTRIFT